MTTKDFIEKLQLLVDLYGNQEICVNMKDSVENISYMREGIDEPHLYIPLMTEDDDVPQDSYFAIDINVQ